MKWKNTNASGEKGELQLWWLTEENAFSSEVAGVKIRTYTMCSRLQCIMVIKVALQSLHSNLVI